ncbi:protein-glutamate O-methyltransferase CheR [bacterium]|nr:MAG: protein-glutamate O-methyltransferase CheR [bacterium]
MTKTILDRRIGREVESFNDFVFERFGLDFSNYRASALKRRLQIRMNALGIDSIPLYIEYLKSTNGEIAHLLDTITIHVTEFFRDRSVFEYMNDKIMPEIIGNKSRRFDTCLRIWSAGCSSGEETYSLAIIAFDSIERLGSDLRLRIYGTDISRKACKRAKAGAYPAAKLANVPKRMIHRYFDESDGEYVVKESLKRRVKIVAHDLVMDDPFKEIDLVFCRNVFIHFNAIVRNKVLEKFAEALKPGGFLVLGKSEAITGSMRRYFELVSARNKVYRKR